MATTATKVVKGPGTDENLVNLDFTKLGPRSGGRAAHVPEGDYLLELVNAKNVPIAGQVGKRQISVQTRIVGTPDYAEARKGLGDTVYTNLQVMPDSKGLWFTRNFIEDLTGKEVTGKAFGLKLDDKTGLRIGATLADGSPFTPRPTDSNPNPEETVRSEIKYTFPAARFVGYNPATGTSTEEDEPEDAPAPKATKAPKAAAEKAAEEVASTDDDDEIEVEELENI